MTPDSRAGHVVNVLFVAWLFNFLIFGFVAQILGGDAVNGRAEEGRYFLADHGTLTQVSKATWLYSRFHVYGLAIHFTILLVALFFARGKLQVSSANWPLPVGTGVIVALGSIEFLKGTPGPAAVVAVLAGLALGSGLGMCMWVILRRRGRSGQG
jgi:hypothetical protein